MLNFAHVVVLAVNGLPTHDGGLYLFTADHGDRYAVHSIACLALGTFASGSLYKSSVLLTFHVAGVTIATREHVHEVRP